MRYSHLTKSDRLEISILLNRGYSLREIAISLKKNHSSIIREIKRNSDSQGRYDPLKANHRAYVKRKYSKYQGMKIRSNRELEDYVRKKLKLRWSPEEIAGRIREVDKHISYVSAVGIYKYLYSVYGQSLCSCLYSHRYCQRKRKQEKTAKEIIKNRLFIDERPKIINEQKRYGDWELDALGAIKSCRARIAGTVERKSKFFLAVKVPRLKYTLDGIKTILSPYQKILVKSMTMDNGVENARHEILGVKTYFCHPYSSWEKGLIENTFMRLRRFIPKRANLQNYSQNKINSFVGIMNNTPRKCLGYLTPNEVFTEQLIKRGGALDY